MKIIKKFFAVLLGLLSLISLFIILCAFFPTLSEKVSDFLYPVQEAILPDEEDSISNSQSGPDGENDMAADAVTQANDTNTADSAVGTNEVTIGGTAVNGEDGADAAERSKDEEYVPPEKDRIKAPENVSGKSGYIPVQETGEQIGDEEADTISAKVGHGETGDGLSFDAEYYPFYAMLDESGQKLYRQITANAQVLNGAFAPLEPVSAQTLRNVFQAVYNDHPELFFLDTAYRGRFKGDGTCAEIRLQFNETADNLTESKEKFEAAAAKIMNEAQNAGSSYEKEQSVHNALLNRIAYSVSAPMNQSAYSALVNGQTVCAGYARAFQYVMQKLGIPCYYCTGYAGQNHAWNIVKLDGDYYNADLTWDDTDPNTFDYFNKTDADFAGTHMRQELSVYLPACNGTQYGNHSEQVQNLGRSPEEAGVSEEQRLTGLEAYFDDCYNQIMSSDSNPVVFQNVLENIDLWNACYDAYQNRTYEDAYMGQVLTELGAASCQIEVQAEELSDGSFLLEHVITFQ